MWSARNAAWWQVAVGAAGAAVNTAVLIVLAVFAARQQRRARNAKLYAAALGISHALEIVLACFDKLHEIDAAGPVNFQAVRRDFVIAGGAIDATPNDVDDASLVGFRANTSTLIQALQATIDNGFHGGTVPAGPFLEASKSLEADARREIGKLGVLVQEWKDRL